ncbi:MFS transporter [uncultured Pseudoteredinibacter sp.]|uniref:MFS transporter n=1 Tax=uncultured Pseudoteredinibacter sp. TaxID=1641701 RepID=UPI002608DAAA|nr:MFS transporter [uncultured Pseudoteredinibacter sp.]
MNSAQRGQALEADEPLPLKTALTYGPPIFGLACLHFMVQLYFMKFATDVLLIAPAVMGLIFGASRIWDAISDPAVGLMCYRTKARMGRCRVWMLGSIPALALTFYLLWNPPLFLSSQALVIWVAVLLIAYYTSDTAYDIPHVALGQGLSRSYDERSRIFGMRQIGWVCGILCSLFAIKVLSSAEDQRAATEVVTLGLIPLAVVIMMIPVVFQREGQASLSGSQVEPRKNFSAFKDVFKNPHARLVLFVWFVDTMGFGTIGLLSSYFTHYVVGRQDLIALFLTIYIASGLVGIPFWVSLSAKFGKSRVWSWAIAITGVSTGLIFFVGEGDYYLYGGLLAIAGFCFGCGNALGMSILTDTVDYDEYKTGVRKADVYSASWKFSSKFGHGLIALISGALISASGFVPNEVQSEGTLLAIRGIFCGNTFIFFMLAAYLISRFSLNREEQQDIARLLKERKGS